MYVNTGARYICASLSPISNKQYCILHIVFSDFLHLQRKKQIEESLLIFNKNNKIFTPFIIHAFDGLGNYAGKGNPTPMLKLVSL